MNRGPDKVTGRAAPPQYGSDGRITAQAYWTVRPGHGELRHESLAPPGPADLVVRATYGAISRGTETLIHRGLVPERLRERMRCPFQDGDFPGPVKYGYSVVGTVVAGPPDWLGRHVFCLHPHQDIFVIPADAARPLPPRLPGGRAILAAGMETALNAIWDAKPRPGDQVCVIGAGVIGLLTGYLARRLARARVTMVDRSPGRRAIAAGFGLDFAPEPGQAAEYPLIFHASGDPAGLRSALASAAFEGRIIELSWYGDRPVTLMLGEDFHDRRLTLQSSQVASVAPSRRKRWTPARRLDRALALLRDDRLDGLISGDTRFETLPQAMAALAEGRLSALCQRIVYP